MAANAEGIETGEEITMPSMNSELFPTSSGFPVNTKVGVGPMGSCRKSYKKGKLN